MSKIKYLTLAFLSSSTLLFSACGARADSISFSESWKDTAKPDGAGGLTVVSQDTGKFNASLNVPGLGALPSSAVSDLTVSVTFGDISFSDLIANANTSAHDSATFFFTESDDNGKDVKVGQITFSRSGDTLTIAGQTSNPTSVSPYPIIADLYTGNAGPIQDQQDCEISLSGALDYDIHRTIFIAGANSMTQDFQGDDLNSVQVSGSADFTPPTLVFVSPGANARVTDEMVTVQVRATDSTEVTDVQFSLGGGDFESGTRISSNLWTMDFDLTPGTNTIRAFAVDASGNVSATNLLKLTYVIVAPLELLKIGSGNISGATNGQLLEIGKTFSLTAIPTKGCKFVNWTGSQTTNTAKLTFVMASNLTFTATFADTNLPVCSITNPVVGQRVSNSVFTVKGKAGDNVLVASVWCQLNTDGWTMAFTTNNWTSWSATNLVQARGTNTIAAYAVDTAGNVSLTNTVKFLYVLTDRLIVSTNGYGTLTPNLNGKLLEIGKTNSMTATAGKGFTFTNWTGSLTTTNTKLTFVMVSNLTFTANFADSARPVCIITNPVANHIVTNAAPVAGGKASDNAGVSNVWFQVNNGVWYSAIIAPNGTNWSTPSLAPLLLSGSNTISAVAVDWAGNLSLLPNFVRFKYSIQPVADWAPDSLNGLLAFVTPSNGSPEKVGFDPATFAQTGTGTNSDDDGAGEYVYLKTGTNMAQFSQAFTVPPNKTNDGFGLIDLVFTNHYRGYFINTNGDGGSGSFSMSIPTNLVPASLPGKTMVAIQSAGGKTNIIKLVNGTGFTQTPANGGGPGTSSGTYTLTRFSPVCGMLTFTFTNTADSGQLAYVLATFTNATAGTYFLTPFNNLGILQDTVTGKFIIK